MRDLEMNDDNDGDHGDDDDIDLHSLPSSRYPDQMDRPPSPEGNSDENVDLAEHIYDFLSSLSSSSAHPFPFRAWEHMEPDNLDDEFQPPFARPDSPAESMLMHFDHGSGGDQSVRSSLHSSILGCSDTPSRLTRFVGAMFLE
jgi:hypothetical protein